MVGGAMGPRLERGRAVTARRPCYGLQELSRPRECCGMIIHLSIKRL